MSYFLGEGQACGQPVLLQVLIPGFYHNQVSPVQGVRVDVLRQKFKSLFDIFGGFFLGQFLKVIYGGHVLWKLFAVRAGICDAYSEKIKNTAKPKFN